MAGQPPSRVDLGSIWFWFLSFDLEKKKRKEEKQLEIEWTKAGMQLHGRQVGRGATPTLQTAVGSKLSDARPAGPVKLCASRINGPSSERTNSCFYSQSFIFSSLLFSPESPR